MFPQHAEKDAGLMAYFVAKMVGSFFRGQFRPGMTDECRIVSFYVSHRVRHLELSIKKTKIMSRVLFEVKKSSPNPSLESKDRVARIGQVFLIAPTHLSASAGIVCPAGRLQILESESVRFRGFSCRGS